MADERMIFELGFGLEEGVKQVEKDWKNTGQKQIQKAIDSKPPKVKLELDAKGLDLSKLREFNQISKEMVAASKANAQIRKQEAMASERERIAEERIATAKARRLIAEERLTQAKQRSVRATKSQNEAYATQSTYLQRLVQRMGVYFGLTQAVAFVRNVRDVTMEFEQQRVALGSIIGDLNEANKMFEQIKAAAVKSPFQIKELVSYTKQLAAYKIETNELFETTQKLADISAGIGVGMERLVLAYGQIRATGYLRASEVRQLTEAGIPIIEELAKKMSVLRGETVSAAEVMSLISERAISFGMVKEVFDDMTSAGGMFYKMQEKQAETLYGQWSNLKDTVAIMYEEIGNTEGVNNAMKDIISLAKSLAENWRDVYSIAQSLSVAMGVYYVMMKNATMASKALSIAEATRLSTLKATTIYMPQFLASTKLAITLTHAYRVAVVKSATATGLLSKAFWGLTKAMLSNPYTAVLAALAGLATLLLTTESRAKRLSKELSKIGEDGAIQIDQSARNFERLAKAIRESEDGSEKQTAALAELKRSYGELLPSQDKEIKALVQEKANYDSLIKSIKRKIELQIQEQKINKIASEYGTRISGAETDFKSLLAQYGLTKEDANKVTSAVKDAVDAGLLSVNNSAKENAHKLKMIIKEQTGLDMLKGVFDPMRVFTQKYGKEMRNEFGNLIGVMSEYNAQIEEVGGSLDHLDDKGKNLSDTFNTWQKELMAITSGKNLEGEAIRIFDDESISQINKLTDATSRVADEYDKLVEEKKMVDKALESEGAKESKETYDALTARANRLQEAMGGLYDFLKKYNALDLIKSDDKGVKDASQALKDELSIVEKIYKRYDELRKLKSESDTQATLAKEFAGVDLQVLAKAYSPQQMLAVYRKALQEAQRLGKRDLALEIQAKIGDLNLDVEQQKMERQLKELSEKIAHTKTAKEFFDKMLGLTGDKELSANVTLSIYGTTGDDLKGLMTRQVLDAFEGVDISEAMLGIGEFDYNVLQKLIEQLPKDQQSNAQSIVDNWRKANADIVYDLQKSYEDFMSFEERKTRVVERETAERAKIAASTYDEVTKTKLSKASEKRQAKEVADISIEEFKASEDWIKSFEDLENLATPTIERLMSKLKEFIDTQREDLSSEQIKVLMSEYDKLYNGLIARNPFKAITDSIKEYGVAMQSIRVAKENLGVAQARGDDEMVAIAERELTNAFDDAKKASTKLEKGIGSLGDEFSEAEQLIESFADMLGVAEDSEFGVFLDGMSQAIGGVTKALGFAQLAVQVFDGTIKSFLASNPIGWIMLAVSGIISAVQAIMNAKVKRLDQEIARMQDYIDSLEHSFERLEKAQEKAFGSDYISNYEQRLANLYAQQESYLKQAELERAKGKKTDSNKVKEYEEAAREAGESIKDMQSELSEYFLGTDLTSAARDFAQSWIDAYKEFGSTTEAMKDKFSDMIENMVVESFAAKVIQSALAPIFDEIDNMSKDGVLDVSEASRIADLTNVAVGNIDVGMTNLMNALSQAGLSVRGMGSDLTGISRDIATASEESILGLAAGINTQNYYISQVPAKMDVIIGLLQGGNLAQGSTITLQDLVTLQNQHLSYLPTIAQHTSETVAECRQIVAETRRTADALERVIKPRGTQATHTMNTSL